MSSANSSFILPFIAGYLTCLASFSMQWVWLYLLSTISSFSAGQTLETMLRKLAQNQIWIQPKIVSVYLTDSKNCRMLTTFIFDVELRHTSNLLYACFNFSWTLLCPTTCLVSLRCLCTWERYWLIGSSKYSRVLSWCTRRCIWPLNLSTAILTDRKQE